MTTRLFWGTLNYSTIFCSCCMINATKDTMTV